MKSKLTPEQWTAVIAAYNEWDPEHPGCGTVSDLAAGWGISKQSMYAELRKRGIPLKRTAGVAHMAQHRTDSDNDEYTGTAIRTMAELLVQAKLRIAQLESLLEKNNIAVP